MRRHRIVVAAAVLAIMASACGGKSSTNSSTSSSPETTTAGSETTAATPAESTTPAPAQDATLKLAFTSDMDPPDPDTNYQVQGSNVMGSVYEGLLEYAPDSSTEFKGLLAESWTAAADGLSYTFKLRSGLTFADGTPLTSVELKAGFERRSNEAVKSPSSYMLLPVAGYETPDPLTFIVKMKYPESAFLSYMASSFSPKAINPKVLADNAADNAIEYLKTQSAGSGPYVISTFVLGQEYQLTRNENYWGEKPYYAKVSIRIIPDAASQVVQLQGGDLDILAGQPAATTSTFEGSKDFQVVTFPVLRKAQLWVNTQAGPTADPAFRAALRSAIDRASLVDQVWGKYATVSKQMYPTGMIADGLAADDWTFDPAPLSGLAAGKKITRAYPADRPADQQAAEALQTQLSATGLDVELVPTQDADAYGWASDLSSAPNLYYRVPFPDSNHPDTWARLFWYNNVASGFGGFLNFLGSGTTAGDTAMDAGLPAVDDKVVAEKYDAAAKELHDQVGIITLADVPDVFIAKAGITGFAHWLPMPLTLALKVLRVG